MTNQTLALADPELPPGIIFIIVIGSLVFCTLCLSFQAYTCCLYKMFSTDDARSFWHFMASPFSSYLDCYNTESQVTPTVQTVNHINYKLIM